MILWKITQALNDAPLWFCWLWCPAAYWAIPPKTAQLTIILISNRGERELLFLIIPISIGIYLFITTSCSTFQTTSYLINGALKNKTLIKYLKLHLLHYWDVFMCFLHYWDVFMRCSSLLVRIFFIVIAFVFEPSLHLFLLCLLQSRVRFQDSRIWHWNWISKGQILLSWVSSKNTAEQETYCLSKKIPGGQIKLSWDCLERYSIQKLLDCQLVFDFQRISYWLTKNWPYE